MSIGSGEFGGSCRINNNFNNNFNLASMVLSFLKDMKTLQEKITQKVQNIKVLKKNFELKENSPIHLGHSYQYDQFHFYYLKHIHLSFVLV